MPTPLIDLDVIPMTTAPKVQPAEAIAQYEAERTKWLQTRLRQQNALVHDLMCALKALLHPMADDEDVEHARTVIARAEARK